ncbi:MAG: glutamate synthase subunit alpha, partial [Chloroflexi bacterium]|nr:glutamate synthase subunit alpha [Chloroflexota bacterium]
MTKNKQHKLPKLVKQGLYDPSFEHDACGVAMIANIKGVKNHDIIKKGLEALEHLGHRGAAGADPKTGDGAGIMTQIPDAIFRNELKKDLPPLDDYAVGMVFLPAQKTDRDICIKLIEESILDESMQLIKWREVPVNPNSIGNTAKDSMPYISQFFVTPKSSLKEDEFEFSLFALRRIIEKKIVRSNISEDDFYICSLSKNTVVYKGLLMTDQVRKFYLDLQNESFISSLALVHSRFSTNTLGSWRLAHPYRYVIHNGEINTHRGNVNWMSAREKVFDTQNNNKDISKLLPIIKEGQSDTASLDNA